jgi:uncharacterized protein YgbK (DUF1537 family)
MPTKRPLSPSSLSQLIEVPVYTRALGVRRLRIGPQIDPGVPWTESLDDPPLALALKSGNFGSPDFFAKALAQLECQPE